MTTRTVPYTAQSGVPFDDALAAAMRDLPDLPLSGVTDPPSLEGALVAAGAVLYVEESVDAELAAMGAAEAALGALVAADMEVLCDDPAPAPFTEDELAALDVCSVDDESMPEYGQSADELEQLAAQLSDEAAAEVASVMSCYERAKDVTARLLVQVERERKLSETVHALEELLYNFRVPEAFFEERLREVDNLLGTFDPLLLEKQTLAVDLQVQQSLLTSQQQELARIPTTDPVAVQRQQAVVAATQGRVTAIQERIPVVQQLIDDARAQDAILLDTFTFELQDYREEALVQSLLDLFATGNVGGIHAAVGAFSTRVSLDALAPTPRLDPLAPPPAGLVVSMAVSVEGRVPDEDGALAGAPSSFFVSAPPGYRYGALGENPPTPHGTLYDRLYGVWGDVERFFTPEERGLTLDAALAAQDWQDVAVGGKHVASIQTYQDFYSNFVSNWERKIREVESGVVEPALQGVRDFVAGFARKEVRYYLSYNKVFELLPTESTQLADTVTLLRQSAEDFLARGRDLRRALAAARARHDDVLARIELHKQEYRDLPCARTEPDPVQSPPPAGTDPIGRTSLHAMDPRNPNITKWCYWLKFAGMATIVGLMPFPDGPGFRYWPIGLVIPGPNGATKIPLPIVWIPLAVVATQIGIFVIFIGQCGVCPSPFVFYCSPEGKKKFIVSLRPTQEFGSDSSSSLLKLVTDGGIAISAEISDLINRVSVPGFRGLQDLDDSARLVEEVKDKIMKKAEKLGLPSIGPIRALSTGHSVADAREALKNSILAHFDRVQLPSLRLPRDRSKMNPKLPGPLEMVAELRRALKLGLPNVEIPSVETISVRDKLMEAVSGLDLSWVPTVSVDLSSPASVAAARGRARQALSRAAAEVTPARLGIVSVLGAGVGFFNAYQCRPTGGGAVVQLPGAVSAAIGLAVAAVSAAIDELGDEGIAAALTGGLLGPDGVRRMIAGAAAAVPEFRVPNPSKLSIKSMLSGATASLSKIQLPSLPDLTVGIQLQVEIPGDAFKGPVRAALSNALDSLPLEDVDLSSVTAVDLKRIFMDAVEGTASAVGDAVQPYLSIVRTYQRARNQSFGELIGLGKPGGSHSRIATVPQAALDAAFAALDLVPACAFPAVAFAPGVFKRLHPILSSDDLPPWERLTLSNFLFVCFLDEWCRRGAEGGGLFRHPV